MITAEQVLAYPFSVRPLSEEDGGGFLIEFPDLPGCVSDGETPEEAVLNGRDAAAAYLKSCAKHGDPMPRPSPREQAKVPAAVSVKRIRARLGLSQAEFARRFGFQLRTLQDWEIGRSKQDMAVRAYLTVIARGPESVERALRR